MGMELVMVFIITVTCFKPSMQSEEVIKEYAVLDEYLATILSDINTWIYNHINERSSKNNQAHENESFYDPDLDCCYYSVTMKKIPIYKNNGHEFIELYDKFLKEKGELECLVDETKDISQKIESKTEQVSFIGNNLKQLIDQD
jgi:hypothetical protein